MGKGGRHDHGKTKNQRKEQIERKRDERSQRNALKKEKQTNQSGLDDGTYKSFRIQLQAQGFKMRDVSGDGNCLFRALADQFDGNENMHQKHRKETVLYMKEHEDDFIPFIEETITFENYLKNLASLGTYGGNDSIVAFARNHGADIIIHQHNNPTFIVEGSHANAKTIIIHLAYHDFEHYSSVRRANDPGTGPACIFHDKKDSIPTRKSENEGSDQNATKDKKKKDKEEIVKSVDKYNNEENKQKHGKNVTKDTCEGNEEKCNDVQCDDYISDAVEQIRNNSGCQDTGYIKNAFIDNLYDTDATLSFILQTMSLNNDNEQSNDDNEQSIDSSQLPETEESSGLNMDGHQVNVDAENDESCPEEDGLVETTNVPDVPDQTSHNEKCEEDGLCNSDVICNEDKKKCCCSNSKSKTCNSSCSCEKDNNTKKGKGSNKERKKVNVVVDRTVKRPTNRQRKELAKQARKKRRQEGRKDSHSSDTQPVESTSEGIQSINI